MAFHQPQQTRLRNAIYGAVAGVGFGLIIADSIVLGYEHDLVERTFRIEKEMEAVAGQEMIQKLIAEKPSMLTMPILFGAIGSTKSAFSQFKYHVDTIFVLGMGTLSVLFLSNSWLHKSCPFHGEYPGLPSVIGAGLILFATTEH